MILRDKQCSPHLPLPHSALLMKGMLVGVGEGRGRERTDSHHHKVHDLWPLTSRGQGIAYPMVGWNLQEMEQKSVAEKKNQTGFLNLYFSDGNILCWSGRRPALTHGWYLCGYSDPSGVMERPGAAMTLTVVWVRKTLCSAPSVVRLTEQGVEAIVQAGTQAHISSVARAVQSVIQVLLWQKLLVVVVSWLLEVVLVKGGRHGFVCIQRASAIQTACAAMSGDLGNGHKAINRAALKFTSPVFTLLSPSSPCIHPMVS